MKWWRSSRRCVSDERGALDDDVTTLNAFADAGIVHEAAFVQSGPPGAFVPGGPAALRTTDFNTIGVDAHVRPVNESFVYLRSAASGKTQVEVFVHIED